MNNTRYAQWILDAIPYDLHHSHVVEGYEVNFLAETHLGDTIHIEQSADAKGWIAYRGVRESDQKVVFLARLMARTLP